MTGNSICVFCEAGDHDYPGMDTTVMRCACPCHGRGPLNSGERPESLDAKREGVVAKERGETRPLW